MKTLIQKEKGAKDVSIDWDDMQSWTNSMLSYPYVTYNRRTGSKLNYYLSFHCLASIFGYRTPKNCIDSITKLL